MKFKVDSRILINREPALPPKMVSVAGAVKSVVNNLKSVIRGNRLAATNEEVEKRISICKSCPKYRQSDARCSLCSCYLNYKTKLFAEHCPIKKW